jgi:hypothetical protein
VVYLEDRTTESNLILLLQLINAGAEVDALLNRGLQYSQIVDLIFHAKEQNLVCDDEKTLKLTDLGLHRIFGKTSSKVKGNWISPLDERRIPSINLDAVYLPSLETKDCIENFNFKAKLLASGGIPQE